MDNKKSVELAALISEVRIGEDEAFSELVCRYTPMLIKAASEFKSPNFLADEALSEAYVALHRAALSYDLTRTDVTFGLYARICVHRHLSDVVAGLRSRQLDSASDVELIPVSSGIESRLISGDTVRRYLKRAREFLSEYEYQVLLLYLKGYSTAETAAELSTSAKSVDNAKARCFKRLREKRNSFPRID